MHLLLGLILTMALPRLSMAVSFDPQDSELPTGVVVDTVHCLHSPQQSYALYLPRQYSAQKKWPVLFLYDPAARGKLPVGMYADLAEEFQLLLICSNNARNGVVATSLEAVEAVTQDVLGRLSIDKQRILISGFSGGSRLAMLVSSQSDLYAGIIACGAGFFHNAQLHQDHPVPYVELIGNRDPNFFEALEVDQYLTAFQYPHRTFFFEGGHQWPPVPEYQRALFWQFLNFYGGPPFPYDKYLKSSIPLFQSQIDSGDFYLAHFNAQQTLADLSPAFLPGIDSIIKKLEADPRCRFQTQEFSELKKQESSLMEAWNQQFQRLGVITVDSAFRNSDWNDLLLPVKRLRKSKSRQKIVLGDRMMGMIALRCAEQYNLQFQSKDFLHATLSARVLTLVENSPRAFYWQARALAARGMRSQSLHSLKKAIDLGYEKKTMIEGDPYLSSLRDEPMYINLLNKMK